MDSRAGMYERDCRERHAGRNYIEFSRVLRASSRYAISPRGCSPARTSRRIGAIITSLSLSLRARARGKRNSPRSVRLPRDNLIGMTLRRNDDVKITTRYCNAKF